MTLGWLMGRPPLPIGTAANTRRARRLLAGCGFVGGLLLLQAVGAIGDAPDPHDPADSVVTYFRAHRNSVYVSTALASAAGPLLVAFLLGLRARVRPGGSIAADTALVAGLTMLGLLGLNELIYLNLAWQADMIGAAEAKPLFVFTILSAVVQGPVCATLFVGVSIAASRCRALPRWHVVAGACVGLVVAASAGAFAQRGYLYADVQQQVVGGLFVLWILVTSACLSTGKPGSPR